MAKKVVIIKVKQAVPNEQTNDAANKIIDSLNEYSAVVMFPPLEGETEFTVYSPETINPDELNIIKGLLSK